MFFNESLFLADLIALRPLSYVIRLGLALVAFSAAMNAEKVVPRVLGLGWLLVTGGLLLLVGISRGTLVDILLGLAVVGAAGYSWWHTRA